MSKLEFYSRPLVGFDPSNRKHREYFADFLKYRGWGHCPVRFICPEDAGMDLPAMIKNQLMAYYMGKEFGKDPDIEKPWVWGNHPEPETRIRTRAKPKTKK
jgi:hypothetical protein